MFRLIVLLKYIVCDYSYYRMESEWYGVYHSLRGVVNGYGRMQFFIYDGDGISKWCERIDLPGVYCNDLRR